MQKEWHTATKPLKKKNIYIYLYLGFRPLQNQRPTVWSLLVRNISHDIDNISLNIAIKICIKTTI